MQLISIQVVDEGFISRLFSYSWLRKESFGKSGNFIVKIRFPKGTDESFYAMESPVVIEFGIFYDNSLRFIFNFNCV